MARRLRREDVVTIKVLAEKGESKRQIARTLGVGESLVRYHLKRAAEGAEDGRRNKVFKAEPWARPIASWWRDHGSGDRPPNVKELYEHLRHDLGYPGSYQSVLRYVRARFPAPRIRTYRRVETPPGAQSQTDWGVFPRVDVGRGPERLFAFLMVLSHSRKPALVWSRRKDQLAWLSCHNRAYRRLGGIAAVNRVDNEKTAVATGAGPWGRINTVYRAYARSVGFHIEACRPRAANEKGKVEAKVKLGRFKIDVPRMRFRDGIEELQAYTDHRLEAWSEGAVCPATGKTVRRSWDDELLWLAPLPILPEPFDVAVTRPVHRDCLVHFEGRSYSVPFRYVGRRVEVRGCAGQVQILAEGRVVQEHPRGTEQRLLIDPGCYEGPATDRAIPPPPLGRMGRRLQEILETPVERRPIDLYAALAEVAR